MSIIRIIGAPATGKTILRSILADALGIPAYGIDDERLVYGWTDRAWDSLASKVTSVPDCIVETSGHSLNERVMCLGRATFTILCTAYAETRRQRLQARVDRGDPLVTNAEHYVGTLLRLGMPIAKPNMVISSDGDGFEPRRIGMMVERARAFLELGAGVGGQNLRKPDSP